ncbi:MAG: restriction endonuclease [Lentisphaerae bacterium]|nr:restriction endonuclease [Lentisphaerota bacterium]
MNVFLHRISHHKEISYPLLERNILTIGWSDFNSTDGIQTFDSDFQYAYGELWRSRYTLYRFLFDMQIGDMVIVPSWGTFSVYKIESNANKIQFLSQEDRKDLQDWNGNYININDSGYMTNGKNIIDLGFFRRVSLIASNIPRAEYADKQLTARMKIRQTNANITDLQKNIESAIEAFNKKQPINLSSKLLSEIQSSAYETIIRWLNPDKWENLIRLYFEKLGASNIDIPSKNENGKDGDSDIIATFDSLKTIYYIQAKFHEGTTTSDWALTQIKNYATWRGGTDDYSTVLWVISSAKEFSDEVIKSAREQSIILISGMEFVEMLLKNGINGFNKI